MWKWFVGGTSLLGITGLVVVLLSNPLARKIPAVPPQRTVFVHLFEWPWADIATECEQYLGPQGFKAVQVSPPQEHVVLPEAGYPWWQRYQPVSYQLESRSGDRASFAEMVDRCRQAGVEIYADAVINHMAGVAGGTGSAGTPFTKYQYPNLYDPKDFHPCRQPVSDYQNAENVTQCELVGLADLNTSTARVQETLAAYLTDLTRLGVAGFRIDAAKHMRSPEIAAILARFQAMISADRTLGHAPEGDRGVYIYQEVIDPGTEAIKKDQYYPNGAVIDVAYGQIVSEAFLGIQGTKLADLATLGEDWGLAPAAQAVVFIDNHDKQRGHGGGGNYLTHKNARLYTLANVFMLAHPYGYPQIMSSYRFHHPDQGPPMTASGATQPVYVAGANTCFEDWVCEHRWPAIGQMVAFRNSTASLPEVTDWWSNGHNQIAFGRGALGFVVINRESTPLTHTFQTQLAPGQYCNVLAQAFASQDGATDRPGTNPPAGPQAGAIAGALAPCSGGIAGTITVDPAGQFTATVAPLSAIALHIHARPAL